MNFIQIIHIMKGVIMPTLPVSFVYAYNLWRLNQTKLGAKCVMMVNINKSVSSLCMLQKKNICL